MPPIIRLTPDIAVSGALTAADIAAAKAQGFKAIVSNRPDGEEPGQLTAAQEAALAAAAGLAFRHVPATRVDLFSDAVVDGMAAALADLDGPVLAHCKSGLRSAYAWAAAAARDTPVDTVVATLAAAGIDGEAVRHELDAQAERG
jgi:uncharacterized protein (TIGR01244 family)